MRVAIIFGGRSVEHEISVLTAHQAMAALPSDRYTPYPVYIAKSGEWYTGSALLDLNNFRKGLDALVAMAEPLQSRRIGGPQSASVSAKKQRLPWLPARTEPRALEPIDVAIPLLHGSHGEDGTIQGLLELANVPYVGSGVAASAVGNDKVLSKALLRQAGLPVLPDVSCTRARWKNDPAGIVAEAERLFGYPVFVKPVTLGSSIGVNRAADGASLRDAIDVATVYDSRIMVEPAQENIVEINCAVLGDASSACASVCEQPIASQMLSYEDKYLQGGKDQGMKGSRRLIPAPLESGLTEDIRRIAVRAFQTIGASGVSRIDFLVRPATGEFFINEINTLPGSLAFYLWEPTGLSFPALLTRLIEIALERHREKQATTYSFDSSVLDASLAQGAKLGGVKIAPR